jgi:spore maturation protein CgeB
MVAAGYSPSVRLFEAATCGTALLSDRWDGIETLLEPGREIALVEDADDVLAMLLSTREAERRRMAEHARRRVLAEHTAAHRAESLERFILQAMARRPRAETTQKGTEVVA